MDKKEHYRQVFLSFKELCASGRQPCSFSKYCKEHDVDQNKIRQILKVSSRIYGHCPDIHASTAVFTPPSMKISRTFVPKAGSRVHSGDIVGVSV